MNQKNVRGVAALVLQQVMDKQRSLSAVLPEYLLHIAPRDQGLLQALCYGVLRHYNQLQQIYLKLLKMPLKGEQKVVQWLILVGLYQMIYLRVPEHAAVSETVNGCQEVKQPKLRNLVNASLRHFQRQQEQLIEQVAHDPKKKDENNFNHPSWLIGLYKKAYPEGWQQYLEANNQPAPMWLRVNRQYHDRHSYQKLLNEQGLETLIHTKAQDALMLLQAIDVNLLPGFDQGWVSVQDAAAQLAVDFIDPQPNESILDCCAAPGGKTMHILERESTVKLTAIDNDAKRLERVQQNLERLQLARPKRDIKIICNDIIAIDQWWDGQLFDKILLDAPCSATGVIRRHPDIKWLRRFDDIAQLVTLQQQIITAIWPLLKNGGRLVYATCSILPQENKHQVATFLKNQSNAQLIEKHQCSPTKFDLGEQLLPGSDNADGFYYACLEKTSINIEENE